MSDQENVLSRWSRRKREVAEAETTDAPGAAQPDVPAAPPKAAPEPDEPLFDLKHLPPIEAISAETDIRAFLASGVPAELKVAALRRAWSVDPAIRDFVGLSENSWDFNDPTAMGGFGPLEMTDDLRRMVAQLFTPGPQEHPAEEKKSAPESPVDMAENAQSLVSEQDEITANVEEPPMRVELSQDDTNTAAVQQRLDEKVEVRSTGRRCHGGALPK